MNNAIRIIVLEDKAVDAHLIESFLKRSDLLSEIRIAGKREIFVELLDSFLPEVILSDHRLPKFSASEALKLSRQKFPFIPFILVTGTISDEFAAGIIKAGGDDYILKDNLKRLPTAIRQAIEKKKTEESLFRSEANLRSIFENTDTAFILLDGDFNVISFNHLATDWLQAVLEKSMTIGDNISNYSNDGNSPRLQALKARVLAGEVVDYETQIHGVDSRHWYHVRFLAVKGSDGVVNGVTLAISDITHRKQLEAERRKTERELLKAHHKLLFHIENAPLGFIEWDDQFNVRSWSKRAEEIFGWTEKDIVHIPKVMTLIVYGEDLHWVTEVARQLSGGVVLKNSIQHRNVTKDGRIIWCEWFNSVQKNSEGKVTTILSLVQDTSDQKESELQREFDSNNLEALINNTEDLMWSVDRDMKLITSNTAFDRIVELMSGGPIAKGSDVLSIGLSKDQLVRYKYFYERALAGETFTEIEHTISPVKNWSEISFYPIRRTGEVIGTACFSRDITTRKTSQESLELTLKRFEQAQQIAHLGHWIVDFVTFQSFWSDEAFRIYGIKPGSVAPSEELFLKYVHPNDLERVRLIIREGTQTFKSFSFFHRIVQDSGEERSLLSVGQFEFDKVNKPTGLYGISLDVTELTEKEKQLELANKELETFIYKIYHDLRAPIASIQGMVNIGKVEKSDLKCVEYFDHIGQVADKQSKMLQNLAACMTIRSRELIIQEFNLDKLIKEVFEELKILPSFKRIKFNIDNKLGPDIISDEELLHNILTRLIENSILFRNEYRSDPRVSIVFKSVDHDSVVIEVEDNGVGMPSDVKEKIFDMFYRGNEVSKGSGLGLYFVKNAVQKLQGTLKLSSTENEGSLFRIILPLLPVTDSNG